MISDNRNYEPQFQRLLQIGIIVRDVDAAVEKFEQDYGFDPWEITVMDSNVPPFDEMLINGERQEFVIKAAMCSCFGMEIELIEPVSDSPYQTWLEEHGPGLHHLAFTTKDEYQKLLSDYQAATGKEPWIRGECPAIGMDFAYLDFTEELGFIAEVYGTDQSEKPGHDF